MSVVSFNAKRSERLMHQALELIEEENFAAAHEIARQLEELRYSGAFEVAARAFLGEGEPEQAVAALERGLALAPEVWSSWQLLGNTLSDLGRYDEAAAAYEKAWACPRHDADSLRFNQAVLASRRGEPEEVLALADKVGDAELRLLAVPARMRALEALGRPGEAEKLGAGSLADRDPQGDPESYAAVAAALAELRLQQGVEKALVRDLVVKEWHAHPASVALLSLLRRIDDRHAEDAKYYRLLVAAQLPAPREDGAIGFFAAFHAIASSPEEALEMYQELDRRQPHAHTRLDQAEEVEARPDEAKGICWMAPLTYFTAEG
jgi:tetratricopeptide (TPR) repeat protein